MLKSLYIRCTTNFYVYLAAAIALFAYIYKSEPPSLPLPLKDDIEECNHIFSRSMEFNGSHLIACAHASNLVEYPNRDAPSNRIK